jgi:hypothetical protein
MNSGRREPASSRARKHKSAPANVGSSAAVITALMPGSASRAASASGPSANSRTSCCHDRMSDASIRVIRRLGSTSAIRITSLIPPLTIIASRLKNPPAFVASVLTPEPPIRAITTKPKMPNIPASHPRAQTQRQARATALEPVFRRTLRPPTVDCLEPPPPTVGRAVVFPGPPATRRGGEQEYLEANGRSVEPMRRGREAFQLADAQP